MAPESTPRHERPERRSQLGELKGTAFADYDRDGRMDIFVVNQGGTPHLYRNVTPRGGDHWLEIDTVGTISNRDGCGARIVLTLAGGSKMTSEVFCSGNDKVAHFGLGRVSKVARLELIWPSGIKPRTSATLESIVS